LAYSLLFFWNGSIQEDIMESNQAQSTSVANALGLQTRQMAALVLTGYRFYQQGRTEDALKIFEGIAVLDSHNAYVQGVLGSIYQSQGELGPAVVRYSNALSIFPDDIHSLTNRGEILVKLGRFQEASEDFKKAIQLDPERKNSAANRARLMVALVQDAIVLAKQKGVAAVEVVRKQIQAK
jgi:tetratricopeptide (TPR) repeat protein